MGGGDRRTVYQVWQMGVTQRGGARPTENVGAKAAKLFKIRQLNTDDARRFLPVRRRQSSEKGGGSYNPTLLT